MVIISGGEKERLEEVFSELPILLAAENGTVIRMPGAHVSARPRARGRGGSFGAASKSAARVMTSTC